MQLNRDAYAGEHTLNNYVKYTDTIQANIAAGNLELNKPIDESCFLNYCVGDTLSVPRVIRIDINDTLTPVIGEMAGIRPEINNYVLLYNPAGSMLNVTPFADAYSVLSNTYSGTYPNQRVGMEIIANNKTPNIAVCYDVATAFCVLGIKARMAVYSTAQDPFYGTIYNFTSITDRDVRDVLSEPDSYWNNHACLCMYATVYIGDENTRTWYRGCGVGSTMGNKKFTIPNIDENTYNHRYINTREVLHWGSHLFANSDCLGQGLYDEFEINGGSYGSGKNVVIIAPYCNPSFWDLVISGRPTASRTRFRMAIFDKMRFYSAYWAYNCTGLFFFDNAQDARTGDPRTNPNVHQGKKRGDGGTSPDETVGADDPELGNGLTDDPSLMYIVTGFDGNDNADENNYIDKTPLSTPTLSPLDVFNRTFAMTAVQIRALADDLFNADDDRFTEVLKGMELYGENPLNGLIDCRLYPFDLSSISEDAQPIIIGRYESIVYGRKILNNANVVLDLGHCKFMKYFKNFLDYAPYTTARLFLPYCGMVPIDTSEFVGKEITCKLIVDLITGSCCCCIFLDEILTITANGVCGVEIAMTGTDSAAFASSMVSQFVNSTAQVVKGAASIAGGATMMGQGASTVKYFENTANTQTNGHLLHSGLGQQSEGLKSLGSGVGDVLSGAYGFWQMAHTPTEYVQRGSSSPSCENWLPQYPYFIIDSPITNIPTGYGHNVGFACIETDTLSNFSGFTICSNVDTSGFSQATQTERDELKTLLENGVFL